MTWTVVLLAALTLCRFGLSSLEKHSAERTRSLQFAGHALESVIVATTIVFLVIRPFVLQAFYIPSSSMEPTLYGNDRVLVNKLSYRFGEFRRNEVVVFHKPATQNWFGSANEDAEDEYVKRIVGLPGDTIEVRNGKVWVNGAPAQETSSRIPANYAMWPVLVPAKSLFVMGDNRPNSNDSHRWGVLPMERVIGRAVLIFWPPSRFGAIPQ